MQLKNQSLSILDNLATQLIHTTAKLNPAQMQEILHGSDTEEGTSTCDGLSKVVKKTLATSPRFYDDALLFIHPLNSLGIAEIVGILPISSS